MIDDVDIDWGFAVDVADAFEIVSPPPAPAPPVRARWSSELIESLRRCEIYESWKRTGAWRRRGRGLADWA